MLREFRFLGSGKVTWRKQPPSRDFTNKQGLFGRRKPGMLLERGPEESTE